MAQPGGSIRPGAHRPLRRPALFLRDLVVGLEHEDGRLGLHPDVGLLEELGRHVLDRLADGLGGIKAALLCRVVVVGAAADALGDGRHALGVGELHDPADKVVLRHPALGIAQEDCELLLHGGWLLLLARIGLHRQVHLLDHPPQDGGVDVVLLQDLGDFVDVNFGHGKREVRSWGVQSPQSGVERQQNRKGSKPRMFCHGGTEPTEVGCFGVSIPNQKQRGLGSVLSVPLWQKRVLDWPS